jgi:hypothetical protein
LFGAESLHTNSEMGSAILQNNSEILYVFLIWHQNMLLKFKLLQRGGWTFFDHYPPLSLLPSLSSSSLPLPPSLIYLSPSSLPLTLSLAIYLSSPPLYQFPHPLSPSSINHPSNDFYHHLYGIFHNYFCHYMF